MPTEKSPIPIRRTKDTPLSSILATGEFSPEQIAEDDPGSGGTFYVDGTMTDESPNTNNFNQSKGNRTHDLVIVTGTNTRDKGTAQNPNGLPAHGSWGTEVGNWIQSSITNLIKSPNNGGTVNYSSVTVTFTAKTSRSWQQTTGIFPTGFTAWNPSALYPEVQLMVTVTCDPITGILSGSLQNNAFPVTPTVLPRSFLGIVSQAQATSPQPETGGGGTIAGLLIMTSSQGGTELIFDFYGLAQWNILGSQATHVPTIITPIDSGLPNPSNPPSVGPPNMIHWSPVLIEAQPSDAGKEVHIQIIFKSYKK